MSTEQRFPCTEAALAAYDAGEQERLDRLDEAQTRKDIQAWLAETKAATEQVGEAFYEDCLHVGNGNSRDACLVTPLVLLRTLVKHGTFNPPVEAAR